MKTKCGRRVRPQLCSGEKESFFLICFCACGWVLFIYLISVCFNLQTIAYLLVSHLGPPRRRTTAEEDEKDKHPKPEVRSGFWRSFRFFFAYSWTILIKIFWLQDSVYYHPTLNPTGAPPPGKPPMYKSSIGLVPFLNLSSFSIKYYLYVVD